MTSASCRSRTRIPPTSRSGREAPAPRYSPEPGEGLAGVLSDSGVIIEILRGRAGVVEAARRLEESGVPTYCSAASLAEIYAGIRPGEEALCGLPRRGAG
jgi:hypothetical protein